MALIDNLISYWKLDEASGNALDAHSTNHLTDNNTVGSAAGKINNGRDFEASNTEYFSLADNAALSTGDIDFSLTAWVNLESVGAQRAIVGKWNISANREYLLLYDNTADRLEFWVSHDGGATVSIASWSAAPSTATWYFIAAWHDAAANTLNIQVNNGTPVSVSHTSGVFNGNSDFRVGEIQGASVPFDGLIDEVGFWKRVLTTPERTALYNSGNGLAYSSFTPTITTTTLPNGLTGTSYSQALAATGGTGSLTWDLSTGVLPTGLSMSAAGAITGTPTVAGVYNFTARVTDSLSQVDTQALTITVTDLPPVPGNKWSKMSAVPLSGMLAWHMYGEDTSLNNNIADYSGNGRHVTCGAGNTAVLQTNLLNGHPGWYFNGSRDPLVYSGNVTVKHLFIVASYEDAAFAENEGLYGGVAAGDILVSEALGDEFFDFTANQVYTYRKADVPIAVGAADAPMSGKHALLELTSSEGFGLDGIQIGKQRGFATRLWKGWFFEAIAYGVVLNDLQRMMINEYFAMKYHLWPTVASGLYRFPFPANKASSSETDQETYLSEPYDGDLKALVRGDFKAAHQFPFALRREEEFTAAKAFRAQHGMLTHWIYYDHRFITPLDYELRFTSPIREQGSDVTYRFNYGFEATEA